MYLSPSKDTPKKQLVLEMNQPKSPKMEKVRIIKKTQTEVLNPYKDQPEFDFADFLTLKPMIGEIEARSNPVYNLSNVS